VAAAPPNDNLASARDIALQPYTDLVYSTGATTEAGETTSYVGCQGQFPAATTTGATVWYRYTATSTATLLVDSIGSKIDTVIGVYSGPSASPTYPSLTYLACGDEEFNSGDSAVSFSVTSGTTYYFQLGGYMGIANLVILNLGSSPATVGPAFKVNSTGDASDMSAGDGFCATSTGECTLRAALDEANNLPGPNFIRFGIGVLAATITPGFIYPIVESVNIDARTQPGFFGDPLVQISGVPPSFFGFEISGGPSTIRGLTMNGAGIGVLVESSDNNVIQGNWLGTDSTGLGLPASTNLEGVSMNSGSDFNTVGGTTAAARNVLSGNDRAGVAIFDHGFGGPPSSNTVIGNYIGLDKDGFNAVPNDAGVFFEV